MITDYASLKAAIARWLKRSDLTDDIPTFIQLAETVFNRRLRTLEMEEETQYSILPTDPFPRMVPVPFGFSEVREMRIGDRPLTYITPSMLNQMNPTGISGEPRFYTIIESQFKFDVNPDGTYVITLNYVKQIPALSESNYTNWLIRFHPDLYLYQSLLASAPFLKDDTRLQTWGVILEGIPGSDKDIGLYEQIKRADLKKRWSGAPLNKRRAISINDGYIGSRR